MNNAEYLAADTLFLCQFCQEEYMLPADTCECPICMQEDIIEL